MTFVQRVLGSLNIEDLGELTVIFVIVISISSYHYLQGFRGVIDESGRIVPNPKGRWYQREPRNYENCLKNHQDWDAGVYEDEKEKTEKLKEKFYSNRYPPLKVVDCPDDTNYIDIFAPPVLHDLLGKIYVYILKSSALITNCSCMIFL